MKFVVKKYGNTHVIILTKDMLKAYNIAGKGSILEFSLTGVFNPVTSKEYSEVAEDEEWFAHTVKIRLMLK